MSNIELFINQYNWREIYFSSYRKDWKKFESKNKSIAVNMLYLSHNTKKIRRAYISKHKLKHESQVIL